MGARHIGNPARVPPEDRALLRIAFCGALVVHLLALLISFPPGRPPAPRERSATPLVVRRYVPPPPPVHEPRRATTPKPQARKIAVPDPTPDAPEPIPEPAAPPTAVASATDADFDPWLGEPLPPETPGALPGRPGGEPLLAGVGGTTLPVRIESSYVPPDYPEIARVARVEGNVVLQAVIWDDGTVRDAEVLRSSAPGFGFEDAAVAAVGRWRYEPATQNGEPVCVYFTILVEFSLL